MRRPHERRGAAPRPLCRPTGTGEARDPRGGGCDVSATARAPRPWPASTDHGPTCGAARSRLGSVADSPATFQLSNSVMPLRQARRVPDPLFDPECAIATAAHSASARACRPRGRVTQAQATRVCSAPTPRYPPGVVGRFRIPTGTVRSPNWLRSRCNTRYEPGQKPTAPRQCAGRRTFAHHRKARRHRGARALAVSDLPHRRAWRPTRAMTPARLAPRLLRHGGNGLQGNVSVTHRPVPTQVRRRTAKGTPTPKAASTTVWGSSVPMGRAPTRRRPEGYAASTRALDANPLRHRC